MDVIWMLASMTGRQTGLEARTGQDPEVFSGREGGMPYSAGLASFLITPPPHSLTHSHRSDQPRCCDLSVSKLSSQDGWLTGCTCTLFWMGSNVNGKSDGQQPPMMSCPSFSLLQLFVSLALHGNISSCSCPFSLPGVCQPSLVSPAFPLYALHLTLSLHG